MDHADTAPSQLTEGRVYHTLIIGGGFAGLGAAIRLLQAGFHDFVLLEKASELGGVWRENTYPGCACDVPSALYSYSFAPNPRWSRLFAGQAEIKQYLQDTAARFKVMPHVHFGQEAVRMAWQNESNLWEVQTATHTLHSQFIILACGPMHEPVLPKLDQSLPRWVQRLFKALPTTQKALRGATYGIFETLNVSMQSLKG